MVPFENGKESFQKNLYLHFGHVSSAAQKGISMDNVFIKSVDITL